MRHQRPEEYLSGNLTAMIDVVFQLIIFFVCTVNMQKEDDRVKLAMAPHGKAAVKTPTDFKIDVDSKGLITVNRLGYTKSDLTAILTKRRGEFGEFPVLIRGDGKAKHAAVRQVMEACTEAGLYKIKFVAIREKAG